MILNHTMNISMVPPAGDRLQKRKENQIMSKQNLMFWILIKDVFFNHSLFITLLISHGGNQFVLLLELLMIRWKIGTACHILTRLTSLYNLALTTRSHLAYSYIMQAVTYLFSFLQMLLNALCAKGDYNKC